MILTALALVCLYAPAKPIPMQTITDQVNGISMQIPANWQRQNHTQPEMRQVTVFKGDRIGLMYQRTYGLFSKNANLEDFKSTFTYHYGYPIEKTRIFECNGMTIYEFHYQIKRSSKSLDNRVLLFGYPGRTFEISLATIREDRKDTTRLLNQIVKTLKVNSNPNPASNQLLLRSIEKKDAKQLKRALANHADPNLKSDGLFVLERALSANQLELAEILLEAGAMANFMGYESFMACAANPKQVELIERYDPLSAEDLKSAAPSQTIRPQPKSLMPQAASSKEARDLAPFNAIDDGDESAIKYYIREGIIQNAVHPESGISPLTYCKVLIASMRSIGQPVEAHLKIRELLEAAE